MRQDRELNDSEQQYMHHMCERYAGLLRVLSARYTSNYEEQNDLIQDTLLRLMAYVEVLRNMNPYKVPSYMALTMKSVFLNQLRHDKRDLFQEVPYDDTIPWDIMRPLPDPYQQLEMKMLLEQLSDHDQLLLKGWYIAGWSAEELAAILGCSKDSIRMKLSRARKRALKQCKEGDAHDRRKTVGKL